MTTTVESNGPVTKTRAKKAVKAAESDVRSVEIPVINVQECELHIEGLTPLIMHRFSEKSRKQMEDKQGNKAQGQKAARDPEQEWRDACYIVPGQENADDWKPGKYFMPGSAFKHVFLYGVAQMQDTKALPKTLATGWLFIQNDPILDFSSVSLRQDTGRIGQGTTTLIYRPQFNDWAVDLLIDYNANTISIEQIVALFDLGGFSGGIGDWRPSAPKNKSGSFGRFRVKSVKSL